MSIRKRLVDCWKGAALTVSVGYNLMRWAAQDFKRNAKMKAAQTPLTRRGIMDSGNRLDYPAHPNITGMTTGHIQKILRQIIRPDIPEHHLRSSLYADWKDAYLILNRPHHTWRDLVLGWQESAIYVGDLEASSRQRRDFDLLPKAPLPGVPSGRLSLPQETISSPFFTQLHRIAGHCESFLRADQAGLSGAIPIGIDGQWHTPESVHRCFIESDNVVGLMKALRKEITHYDGPSGVQVHMPR